jgi:hypothetical protein
MFARLEEILIAQFLGSAVVLVIFAIVLAKRRLFHWTTTGFWTWIAFAMYFCLNPLASIWWNIEKYRVSLQLSGGFGRAEWIGIVSLIGMSVFFISYLRTGPKPVTWNLPVDNKKFTAIMTAIIVGFMGIAILSLLTYRIGVLSSDRNVAVQAGRFTGDVTGYDYIAHTFIFVPIVILLLSSSCLSQSIGLLFGIGYVILRMPDEWGRWSVVTMLLAMSLAATIRRAKKWPPAIFFVMIILIAAVLTLRGHTSVDSGEGFWTLVLQIPDKIGFQFTHNNTDMLAFWYIESYIKDSITGYDFGLPFLNYAISGFIPGRFFPHKYFLIEWLSLHQAPLVNHELIESLFGSKPTLMGSFYSNGGLIAVIISVWVIGILFRKIDGMLSAESPILVKAIGIVWISCLWMVWGSQDYWGLTVLGSLAIPVIVLWAVAPKQKRASRLS